MYISEKYFKTTSDYFSFLLKHSVIRDGYGEYLDKIDKHDSFKIKIAVISNSDGFESFFIEKTEGALYEFDIDAIAFCEINIRISDSLILDLIDVSDKYSKDLTLFKANEMSTRSL